MTVVHPVPPVPLAASETPPDAEEISPRSTVCDAPKVPSIPAKNALKNMSSGVGPSVSAYRSRPQEELERLCYQTTTNIQFAGRSLGNDGRCENMADIFCIGQKRFSKYMNYQMRRAPLLDRSSCQYTREFGKPASAGTLATDIAEFIKQKQDHARGPQARMDGRTRYSEEFCDWNAMFGATVTSACEPLKGSHDPIGKVTYGSAEKLSHSHKNFAGMRPLSATERARPPRSNVGPSNSFFDATSYHITSYDRNFVDPSLLKVVGRSKGSQPLQRCTSAPAGGRRVVTPASAQRPATPASGQRPATAAAAGRRPATPAGGRRPSTASGGRRP